MRKLLDGRPLQLMIDDWRLTIEKSVNNQQSTIINSGVVSIFFYD
jgi:hypothetical protein